MSASRVAGTASAATPLVAVHAVPLATVPDRRGQSHRVHHRVRRRRPMTGEPPPDPAPAPPGLHRFGALFGAVIAPTSFVTALLYYFGFNQAYYFYDYFGVNSTALGLGTTDFLMISVDALFRPMVVAAAGGLVAFWGHELLRARIAAGARPRVLRVLVPVLGALGALLAGFGLAKVLVPAWIPDVFLLQPLSLAAGVVLLAYTLHLRRTLARTPVVPPPNPLPHPATAPTPPPEPGPNPDPSPEPGPNLGPSPEPGPNPNPDPSPEPGPNLGPSPEPGPNPNPGQCPHPHPDPNLPPEPAPHPSPRPSPEPGPGPHPAPHPEPTPDPDPRPDADPHPHPGPDPRPVPGPAPEPGPSPEPGPAPEPGPTPEPSPGPGPEPGPSPRPEPSPGPPQAPPAPPTTPTPPPRPEWSAMAEWAVVFVLVGLSLVWAATDYAAAVGRGRAAQLVVRLPGTTTAVVHSTRALALSAPGIRETRCADAKSGYPYRYEGLTLVIQSANQFVLLPQNWTATTGVAVVLPRSDSVRLEFVTPRARKAALGRPC
ncbi:hypothetical protein ACIO3O_04635 [Streptomyces sp. NPDC087440]|uniref:hypothetical protein n=1 Tax=Streptomyces sp. NPDC087440 TaxID=3365790 RepID=UPI00382F5756